MKILKTEYGIGQQSINFKEIRESDDGTKILIEIKSDSYDFQSYARLSAFSPTELKWNQIGSIHYSEMNTPSKLCYSVQMQRKEHPSVLAPQFQKDLEQLVQEAEMLLGQKFTDTVQKKPKIK